MKIMHITIERKTTVYKVAIVLYALLAGSLQAASGSGWTDREWRKLNKDRIQFDELIEYFGLKEENYKTIAAMKKKKNTLLKKYRPNIVNEDDTEKDKKNKREAALLADILKKYQNRDNDKNRWTAFINYKESVISSLSSLFF